MARRYYDTPQRVFQLFKNHPALSQMYSEFGIEIDGIKRVAEFLVLNHEKVEVVDLKNIYKSQTINTFEPDQEDPVKGSVDIFNNLPTMGLEQGDIYLVEEPYPGTYYYWDGAEWKQDPNSIDKSRIQYLTTLYQERGHKVWEPDSGTFIAMETEEGKIEWEAVNGDQDYTIIRISDLPKNPVPGDIYKVLGEDLIDIISSLYGLVDMGMVPPWDQYVSSRKTNLQELLNMTVYLYRYGVTDNFYEKNIWQFIPEYDRDLMLEEPKIKLFMESIGRKLDQLEDKLTRLQDVYDIDEVPDEMLDHLGQMLGYEKEDFSLSNVSFRELLKNIIEIYKIKGTNYSFSFFFKFLGFNVNLKEFYFNRNVQNPESFPGVDVENVEYYLTTKNPIFETEWGNPASNLEQIRSLDDWDLECDLLVEAGCSNPINYMLGRETYNNDGLTWHKNPWTFFKTNLIEYELNPFFEKVNLTSSDNETIKKYIKFLSPTYLFTWINVNLAPWIEDINIFENSEEWLTVELNKTLGDFTGEGFKDYDNVVDYFQVWDEKQNKLIPYTEADEMLTSIVNNLNLGGDDRVGAQLRHDGVYIRQPGHPSHITNVFHDGATRLNFDNLGIMIKRTDDVDYDNYYSTLAELPTTETEDTVAFVEETGLYYIYKDPAPYWELIENSALIPSTVDESHTFSTYSILLQQINAIVGDIYRVSDTNRYYMYHNDDPLWVQASDAEHRYHKWLDYSYRPYPSYPINVKPSPGIKLKLNEVDFIWDEIYAQEGYWVQVSKDINFSNLVFEEFIYDGTNYVENVLLENDNYFWRVRTKNNLSILQWHMSIIDNIETTYSNIKNYFVFDGVDTYSVRLDLTGQEKDELVGILAATGNKFDWGQWSSIYRFEISGLPFPYDGQVIDDISYQYINQVYDQITGEMTGISLNLAWKPETNVETYEVVIAIQPDMSQVIYMSESEESSMQIELPNGDYYWRYRLKKFNQDWQDYSNVMHFTLDI